jgi:hypothetical protein
MREELKSSSNLSHESLQKAIATERLPHTQQAVHALCSEGGESSIIGQVRDSSVSPVATAVALVFALALSFALALAVSLALALAVVASIVESRLLEADTSKDGGSALAGASVLLLGTAHHEEVTFFGLGESLGVLEDLGVNLTDVVVRYIRGGGMWKMGKW